MKNPATTRQFSLQIRGLCSPDALTSTDLTNGNSRASSEEREGGINIHPVRPSSQNSSGGGGNCGSNKRKASNPNKCLNGNIISSKRKCLKPVKNEEVAGKYEPQLLLQLAKGNKENGKTDDDEEEEEEVMPVDFTIKTGSAAVAKPETVITPSLTITATNGHGGTAAANFGSAAASLGRGGKP